jgi:peptidoglycan/xylan/chitin deacetylase (PgdA/CDA1 family)
MTRRRIRGAWLAAMVLPLLLAAPGATARAQSAQGAPLPSPRSLPEFFESEEFVVTFAREGDTAERLAQRFLGDPAKAWTVEEFNQTATFAPGQKVVIPKQPWNLPGIYPDGYQLVPVLCYHDIAPEARGRLRMSVRTFEGQMRYLKAQGYTVVSLAGLLEFAALRRQLPRKTVVLTFDDGWKSFRQHAVPILRELGFPATLFIYTDFIGGGAALTWDDLRELAREGFDIQAHSKTHGDLRRKPGEPDAEYLRRLDSELLQPQVLFRRHLGEAKPILAYPYGSHDEEIEKRLREAGYWAALDVRRQGNPAFTPLLGLHRAQIYAEMTLEQFARNLTVFAEETIR